MGEPLAGFGRETFEVIADECPNVTHFSEVALDFKRPAFQSSFAFPKEFIVAMNEEAVAIVLRRIIAEQPQVKKIGRARQEFKGREISFIERAGIGPDPANPMLFQETNDLWPMPAGVTKFNSEAKISRQLLEEFAKCLSAILGSEGRRQLDENDLKLWFERLDCAEKSI